MVSVTVGGVALQSRQPVTVVSRCIIRAANFVQRCRLPRDLRQDIPVPPRE